MREKGLVVKVLLLKWAPSRQIETFLRWQRTLHNLNKNMKRLNWDDETWKEKMTPEKVEVELKLQRVKSSHPNIKIDILHTSLYTFPGILTRRIGVTIRGSSMKWCDHFLHPYNLCISVKGDTVGRNWTPVSLGGWHLLWWWTWNIWAE